MCHWVSKLGSCCDNKLGGQNDEAIETSHAEAAKALGVVLPLAFFFLFFFKMEEISTFFSFPHLVKEKREENNNVLTRFYKIKFWPE